MKGLRESLSKALQYQRYSFVERAKLAAVDALTALRPPEEE